MTDFDSIFKKYLAIKESTPTLFTCLIHNVLRDDFIVEIGHRLQLARDMKPSRKKTIACERLILFKNFIEMIDDDRKKINSIYLISAEIAEIPLENEWLKVIKDYNIHQFIFKYNYQFEIQYLKSLLTDLNYKDVINVKNNEYTHVHLCQYKKRIHYHKESKNFSLCEYIQNNIVNPCLIHGQSSNLKNIEIENHFVYTKMLTDDEILEVFRKNEIQKNLDELGKYLDYLNNKKLISRLVFGKDIEKQIKEQGLCALYCSPEIYSKVICRVPQEYLGKKFKICQVESLNRGDNGDRLVREFSGAIGITYF